MTRLRLIAAFAVAFACLVVGVPLMMIGNAALIGVKQLGIIGDAAMQWSRR